MDSPVHRVLIVDDDYITANTFARLLGLAGYPVDTAASASSCVAALKRQSYHIILLDLQLDKQSGLILLRRLRRAGIRTPIVIVTGFGDLESAVTAFRNGATDFVTKPVFEDELLATVRRNAAPRSAEAKSSTRSQSPDGGDGALAERLAKYEHTPQNRAAILMDIAHASVSPLLSMRAFIKLATVFRMLLSSPPSPFSTEVRDAIRALREQPRSLNYEDARIAAVFGGLASGDRVCLARSEEEWSALVGITASQLGRQIRRISGLHFRDLRLVYRIHEATKLVLTSNEQSAQIAFSVGYGASQPTQFSREFRRFWGVSPTVFRRLVE